jgi:GT2 family glycosyltransferase
MAENKLTYIIVLHYNAYQDTIDCLESILNLSSKYYEIVLVDNASTDLSLNSIQKWIIDNSCDSIKILKSNNNGGYSTGNNLGIKYASKEDDCEYIWILNNDTVIEPDSLRNLINSDKKKDIDTIWGSKILYPNGRVQSLGCRINNKFMLTYHNHNNLIDKDSEFEIDQIDYIHGCSMFFNKSIIGKIGYFSEEYFMFFDDVDFCKRAVNQGIQLNISQKSIVIHKEGKTIKKNKLEYLSVINRIKYAKKYFSYNLCYVYMGICYKILKSICLLKFNLAKKIIFNLFK